MTTHVPRRFRIGSATIVFSILSVFWFLFNWRMLEGGFQKAGGDASTANMKSALWMTTPLLGVALVALVSRNLTQSEAHSWVLSGVAFLILAIVGVSLLGRVALSYS